MFSILGSPQRLCDRTSRREFLRVGSVASLGLTLPMLLQARTAHGAAGAAASTSFGRAKHCILLFLTGGPPQLDTFDLKPDAPVEIRGEFKPIDTATPGVAISELFPQLARAADKFCIVRSVTHNDAVHTSAGYAMLTGVPHPGANAPGGAASIVPSATDHPHLGSLLARFRPAAGGMPTSVALPEVIKDAGVNEFPGQGAGLLGKRFEPFRVESDDKRQAFRVPDVVLPADITAARLDDRRELRDRLAELCRLVERQKVLSEVDGFYEQAFGILSSPATQQAFDLGQEPERLRARYGNHLFGRGCLLARRLVETGVSMATVYWHYEGPDDSPVWDTHNNNFAHMRERLAPPTDQAVAALLDDLQTRGLLDETLVIVMGEFGRTPKISREAGRGHWPFAQSILLAGAGIPGGTVYGKTDRHAAYPAEKPVTPADLAATILHLTGVDPTMQMHDALGRPHPVNRGGILRDLVG